ncbi:Ti-type conjugative transfer relaxase traa [Sphingomonas paucimobilis]|nr:Ti-type conjugative transfer relaxase traa [Sphingomonas paucimobilis]
MLLKTETEIWAQADAAICRIFMAGDRTARRMLAADRTIEGARRRCEVLRKLGARRGAIDHAGAEQEVERSMSSAWGKALHIRMPRSREAAPQRTDAKRRSGTPIRAARKAQVQPRAIRKYKAPLVDGRGRVALYLRVRYMGLKSKKWRLGISADHVIYILREAALETDGVYQNAVSLTNMGETVEEIAACWRALEAVEEGYRANAKVQYRIVWNLPHQLTPAQRHDLVRDFCERNFGRLGLPWVAAVHRPDESGDERNYHAHVCFSTRPCERIGDHQWVIAQEKVNGLTDEAGLKRLRAEAAAHMNQACRKAELEVRFTHQSYQERGLNAERQAHVGPERMAAHDRGEAVAVIEQNARIVERNEAARVADDTAHVARLTERLMDFTGANLNVIGRRRRIAEVSRHVGQIRDHIEAVGRGLDGRIGMPSISAATAVAARSRKIVAGMTDRHVRAVNAEQREKAASILATARAMAARRQHHDLVETRRIATATWVRTIKGRIQGQGDAAARLEHLLAQRERTASDRRGVVAIHVLVRRIAERAKVSLDGSRWHTLVQVTVAIDRIAKAARAIPARMAEPASCVRLPVRSATAAAIRTIAAKMRGKGIHDASRRAHHTSIATSLANVRATLAGYQEMRVVDDRQEARRLLLEAERPPYATRDGKVMLDLSRMTEAQSALIRAMDRQSCIDALGERIRRDREQDAARQRERDRQLVEAERLASLGREALVSSASLALARTVSTRKRRGDERREVAVEAVPPPSDWAAARTVRERAMRDWDATQQRDDRGLARPGRSFDGTGSAPENSRRQRAQGPRFDPTRLERDTER